MPLRLRLLTSAAIVFLALGAAVIAGDAFGSPRPWRFLQPNLKSTVAAYFEFAPTSGSGMGTACACAAVTGSKGETMTFARASTGTCVKGNISSGIADSDLVSCASGQPRVMPGGDGTGALGLLVEGARTNSLLRSEEIDSAAWADFTGTGGTTATLNGTCATSPLAAPASTPEDYTFAATTGTQSSARSQVALSAAAYSGSVYVKGVSGSGTMDVCVQTGASTATCAACAFVSTSWTRCKVENVTSTASGNFYVGNLTSLNGGTARSASRVCVTAAQAEASTRTTSYIPTTTATAARVLDAASFSLTAFSGGGSIAGTMAGGDPIDANQGLVQVAATVNGTPRLLAYFNTFATCYTPNRTPTTVTASGAITISSRLACWLDGSGSGIKYDGTTNLGNSGTWASAGVVQIGYSSTAPTPMNGVIKQVCVDPSSSRCR